MCHKLYIMTTISTTIIINASAKKVWEILKDFEAYGSWNPFIPSIQYKDKQEKNLKILICPPNGSAMKFEPIIMENSTEKVFAWQGKLFLKGVFDGYHSFKLEENETGQTTFTQSEIFSGLLVPLFKKSLETKTLEGFKQMNLALKRKAEDKG